MARRGTMFEDEQDETVFEQDEQDETVFEQDEPDETVFEPDETVSEQDQPDESEQDEPASEPGPGGGPEKAEPVIDLTGFQAAVKAALDERDETTGELPLAAIEPVNTEYRALDGRKAKNQASTWVEAQMVAALSGEGEGYTEPDFPTARALMTINKNLSAGKATSEPKVTDPVDAYVKQVAALSLALDLIEVPETDRNVQDEVDSLVESVSEQATKYLAWLNADKEGRGDAPQVSPVAVAAAKLSIGRSTGAGRPKGSGNGLRRDVAVHIKAAFEEVPVGTFLSVAQICKHRSDEYGSDSPSPGAVQNRLFPKSGSCTVEGIEPVPAEGSTPRGARKVA